MTREPYILTPADLLDAERRLFQADVDLTVRSPYLPATSPHPPANAGLPQPGSSGFQAPNNDPAD